MNTKNNKSDIKERVFYFPRSQMYAAFSNPELLAKWWGPSGFSNTFKEFDLRTGGFWRFTMHGPDKKDYPNEIFFVEVKENEKVVMEHFEGHHFLLTLTFSDVGDNTLLMWQQEFDTVAHYQHIADFVSKANNENLDKLERVLTQQV